jgi:acyl-coenzyme A thioesterase PaaI-like protein
VSQDFEDTLLQQSAINELGLTLEAVGDELHGWADVRPTMWAPGTEMLRTSVAMTWADTLLGLHALKILTPRLTVTLELDAHLFDDVVGIERIHGRSRLVKAGQQVIFTTLDFLDDGGRLVGFGSGSFMAIPDPKWTAPPLDDVLVRFGEPRGNLVEPLTERIGSERVEPGTVVLPCTPAVHNASQAINGGMLAVAVEEATLSADPTARWVESIHLRYLRSIRVGPAVARADVHYGMGRVEVHDAGTDKIAAIATTRARELPPPSRVAPLRAASG